MKIFEITGTGDLDELVTLLWELGTVGLVEQENSLRAYFPETIDLAQFRSAMQDRTYTVIEDEGSLSCPAADNCDPSLLGRKFAIVSSASHTQPEPGRTVLLIDAQNAFGSGRHESTQLTVQALEDYLTPNSLVLDIGSGSGIVSSAAHHLGAKSVFACDTHLDSVYLTRRHAPHVHAFAGSIDSIASASVHLAIANISAPVIDTLAADLHRIVKPQGHLILSGFISDRVPQSFSPLVELSKNEWLCWVCQPAPSGVEHLPKRALQPFPVAWW